MSYKPLLMVVKELYFFVVGEIRNCLPRPKQNLALVEPKSVALLAPLSQEQNDKTPPVDTITSLTDRLEQEELATLYQSVANKLPAKIASPVDHLEMTMTKQVIKHKPIEPSVMYVTTVSALALITPYRDFDNVLADLPYGTAVTVTNYQAVYAQVFWSQFEGWILKDNLSPHKAQVWPQLTNSYRYEADDEAVEKLRLLIGDVFHLQDLSLPLQAGEWVVYRLREQNRFISWPQKYQRLAGNWQSILKGTTDIHIGIVPKLDSIMEWQGEDRIGRVAYVERVSSDQTITISVVGFAEPGCYEKREITQVQWRELRPVFIEIM